MGLEAAAALRALYAGDGAGAPHIRGCVRGDARGGRAVLLAQRGTKSPRPHITGLFQSTNQRAANVERISKTLRDGTVLLTPRGSMGGYYSFVRNDHTFPCAGYLIGPSR